MSKMENVWLHLIEKHLFDRMSEKEEQEFQRLYQNNESFRNLVLEMEAVDEAMATLASEEEDQLIFNYVHQPDNLSEDDLELIQKRVETNPSFADRIEYHLSSKERFDREDQEGSLKNVDQKRTIVIIHQTWFRIAASVLLLAGLFLLGRDFIYKQSIAEQWAANQPQPALHVDFATTAGPDQDKPIAYYYNHREYEKLTELLQAVIDTTQNPVTRVEYQFFLGTVTSRSGNRQEAIQLLKPIAESQTNLYRNDAKLELAYAYILEGHLLEAQHLFQALSQDQTILPYYHKRAKKGLDVIKSE